MSKSELTLPANFDEYIDTRKAGFIKAKEYKENGGHIAGYLCSYAPLEILDAAGFATVGLCGMSNETIPAAESVLPQNICPLVKSTYGFALTEKCPYTYFSDIIVGETTCDGKKKMYELMGELRNMHIMQLPQGQGRSYSSDVWYEECKLLNETIEEQFGIEITDEKLRQAVKNRNRYRKAIMGMYELQKLDPPAMHGAEVMTRIMKGTFNFDPMKVADAMEDLIAETKARYDAGERPVPATAKRILLTGCPSDGVINKVAKVIEDNGATIVCLDSCSGERSMKMMVDEDADDIMRAISDRYLQIHCSVMTPNDGRMENLQKMIRDNKVDGVVECILTACHTFNIEAENTKKACEDVDTPYMKLETDYSESDAAQLATRITAFIEML